MCENNILKRIPGAAPISPKEKQGYVQDFNKLSKIQLMELLERQNSILRNTAFLKRLPDKGEKISAFKNRLQSELNRRKEVEQTTALLEKLNINSPVEEIEWTGNYSEKASVDEETRKGHDGETEVIRMLASQGITSKTERVLKPPEELITKKDLEEIHAIKDPYAKVLGEKVAEINNRPAKEIFRPFRTLKNKGDTSPKQRPNSRSSVSDDQNAEGKESDSPKSDAGTVEGEGRSDAGGHGGTLLPDGTKRHRHWEVTAATPLVPVHERTLLLDLDVSIALEKAAIEKTIEARTKQSMARLKEQLQRGNFTQYRNVKEVSSDDEDDDEDNDRKKEEQEECGDEDEEPERDVAVVYSVVDCNDEAS